MSEHITPARDKFPKCRSYESYFGFISALEKQISVVNVFCPRVIAGPSGKSNPACRQFGPLQIQIRIQIQSRKCRSRVPGATQLCRSRTGLLPTT